MPHCGWRANSARLKRWPGLKQSRWLISIPEAARVSDQLRREAASPAIERRLSILPGKLDEHPRACLVDRSIPNHRQGLMPLAQFDASPYADALLQVAEQRAGSRPDCFRGQRGSWLLWESSARMLRDTMTSPVIENRTSEKDSRKACFGRTGHRQPSEPVSADGRSPSVPLLCSMRC